MLHLDALNSPAAEIILSLSIMLLAGFLATRLTQKLRLPNVTGYILAGIAVGPYVLGLVPGSVIDGMDFVTDIALAFIAFGVGRYFKLEKLKETGAKVIVITLLEALAAFGAVTAAMLLVFRLPLPFCLLLGAISSATAPASTIMTIRQYRAKGPFVNLIVQIVALDDAVALVAFSMCSAVVSAVDGAGAVRPMTLLAPLLWSAAAVLSGVLAGLLLHALVDGSRSREHRLVLVIAVLLAITGLCAIVDISPLLACMAVGTAYINAGGRKLTFEEVSDATPPILLIFFVLSGARLQVPMLATAGLIGVCYFFVRILGKYLGAWAGCAVCRTQASTRRWLGLALVPQAGVSIGLAALAERILPGPEGLMVSTIILSSGVLYEMVGPACAKAALFLSGTVRKQPSEEEKPEEAAGEDSGYPKAS